jgi:hypothetical protein
VSDAGGAISLVALCNETGRKGTPRGEDAASRDLKRSLDSFNNMLHIMNNAFGVATRGPGVDRTVKAIRAAFLRCSSAVLGHDLARAAVAERCATAVPRLEELVAEFSHIESVNPNKAVYSNRALLLLSRAEPDGLGSAESVDAIAAGAMVAQVYGRKLSTTAKVQNLEQDALRLKASNEDLSKANERLKAALDHKEKENDALREQLARHGIQATTTTSTSTTATTATATATATATDTSADTMLEDMLSTPLGLSSDLSVALGEDLPVPAVPTPLAA